MTASAARVGFVVIGRNEGERLVECLRSILARTDRVVYADSASTDGSVQRAWSLGVEAVAVEGRPLTAARGRNAGFEALRRTYPECDLVHFVDGDCVIAPAWLDTAISFLTEHPEVAVVCGRRFEAHPQASFYNRVIDGEWDTPVGPAESCGGDALVRVNAFEQAGGYRSELIAGEEPDFCARLRAAGWQIWRLDAQMTEHDAAIYRLSQWMKRAARSGFGYAQVWKGGRGERLYGREMLSAIGWVMALPLTLIAGALLARQPLLILAAPAVYALQVARIAFRKGGASSFSWKYALLVMLAKAGEAGGVIRYFVSSPSRQSFDYKELHEQGRHPA